jgi:hypothetical protein
MPFRPLLLALLVYAQVFAARAETPDNLQLFLLIGQSNMAGRGTVGAQDQVTNPRIFMLDQNDQWVLAKDPVHFDKPQVAGVGLCSEFARTLAKRDESVRIGLIPCAVGGTSLEQWKPGGKLYASAVERAHVALKSGKLAGILWHQGEADSSKEKTATYADRFAAMIAQLRTDLSAEKVPVIVGELGRFRPNFEAFNANLPAVVAKVPRCALVTTEDLVHKGDQTHFDSPSLRTLGKRYADAYLKLAHE